MYGVLGIKRANIMFNSFRGLSFICLCDNPGFHPGLICWTPLGFVGYDLRTPTGSHI